MYHAVYHAVDMGVYFIRGLCQTLSMDHAKHHAVDMGVDIMLHIMPTIISNVIKNGPPIGACCEFIAGPLIVLA